jgi:hypothetical protein
VERARMYASAAKEGTSVVALREEYGALRGGVYGVTDRNARRKEYHRRTSRVTPSARTLQGGVVTIQVAK